MKVTIPIISGLKYKDVYFRLLEKFLNYLDENTINVKVNRKMNLISLSLAISLSILLSLSIFLFYL